MYDRRGLIEGGFVNLLVQCLLLAGCCRSASSPIRSAAAPRLSRSASGPGSARVLPLTDQRSRDVLTEGVLESTVHYRSLCGCSRSATASARSRSRWRPCPLGCDRRYRDLDALQAIMHLLRQLRKRPSGPPTNRVPVAAPSRGFHGRVRWARLAKWQRTGEGM